MIMKAKTRKRKKRKRKSTDKEGIKRKWRKPGTEGMPGE
jgi:hypothetical protein